MKYAAWILTVIFSAQALYAIKPQNVEEATQQLLKAAESGDVPSAVTALQAGAVLNPCGRYCRAIKIASEKNNREMVQFLMSQRAIFYITDVLIKVPYDFDFTYSLTYSVKEIKPKMSLFLPPKDYIFNLEHGKLIPWPVLCGTHFSFTELTKDLHYGDVYKDEKDRRIKILTFFSSYLGLQKQKIKLMLQHSANLANLPPDCLGLIAEKIVGSEQEHTHYLELLRNSSS